MAHLFRREYDNELVNLQKFMLNHIHKKYHPRYFMHNDCLVLMHTHF